MSPLLIVIIVLVLALVIFALRGKGTATMERLHVERNHDWEKEISEADEEALLAGIEKWRDSGHDLVLYHEGAKIDVFQPSMVISLYALEGAFRKNRDAQKILNDWAAREVAGASMHLPESWSDPAFAKLAAEVLSEPSVQGVERAGTDEVRGVIDLGVKAGGPTNTVAIDLGRLKSAVAKLREEDEKSSDRELVRRALTAAIERDTDGVLWMRTPSEAERDVARRGISRI
ncbi:MAG: hypothetical protein ACXVEF_02285 [Polyangiales bacterium]